MTEPGAQVASIEAALHEQFVRRADEFGLDPTSLRVEYVINLGGFVNLSFRVTDGGTHLHLKLSNDPEGVAAVRRWHALREPLEQRYHAPPMVGWIEPLETGHQGPVFRWIDGRVPAALTDPLKHDVLRTIHRLHHDHELLSGADVRCRDLFLDTFDDRATQDLLMLEETPIPFVTASTLRWLHERKESLRRRVLESAAFDESVSTPIHADLWLNNLLVAADTWYLLDWDDLRIGDPALDLAVVLGPTTERIRPANASDLEPRLTYQPGVLTRLALYAEATVLDWAIDPLADYIDAGDFLTDPAPFRAEKLRVHEAAVACLRSITERELV